MPPIVAALVAHQAVRKSSNFWQDLVNKHWRFECSRVPCIGKWNFGFNETELLQQKRVRAVKE